MAENLSLPNYDILLENGWETLRQWLREQSYSQILILVDTNTRDYCLPILSRELPDMKSATLSLSPGEANKVLDTCQLVWEYCLQLGMDRHSLIINLGGGVIGDMGGFCAATYMRGIDFIQIPTTLLAQVDASIGGKVGIDFMGNKNTIGAFSDPKLVLIDPRFLRTLPPRELLSGFAEMLKHALITSRELWDYLKQIDPLEHKDWLPLIEQSLRIKRDIVLADPREQGLRKVLNVGHTFGHALESLFLETEHPMLHGEAIALGICLENGIALERGLLPEADYRDMMQVFQTLYQLPELSPTLIERLMHRLHADKKRRGNQIYLSLIGPIGKVHVDVPFLMDSF